MPDTPTKQDPTPHHSDRDDAPGLPEWLQHEELQPLLTFLQRWGRPVLYAVLLAMIGMLIVSHVQNKRQDAAAQAARRLADAQSVQELEAVLEEYKDSPAAPLAILRMAKLHYDHEAYDLAHEQYKRFLETHGSHMMAPLAELGRLHTLEGKNQIEHALQGYRSFTQQHPGHYLTAQAVMGHARCLELLDRDEEARAVVQTFLDEHSDNAWADLAEDFIDTQATRRAQRAARASMPLTGLGVEPIAPGPGPEHWMQAPIVGRPEGMVTAPEMPDNPLPLPLPETLEPEPQEPRTETADQAPEDDEPDEEDEEES